MRHSFVLKVAPKYGKRYGELPKARPCNILKHHEFIYVCVDCELFLCFSVPKRYPSGT